MKKSELKKILKPLIKECIREVVFEEGVLSGLISEVVNGTSSLSATVPPRQEAKEELIIEQQEREEKVRTKIKETKKKMLDAIGNENYNGVNLFEGTQPATKSDPHSPMTGTEPGDKGVDITAIPGARNWNKLI